MTRRRSSAWGSRPARHRSSFLVLLALLLVVAACGDGAEPTARPAASETSETPTPSAEVVPATPEPTSSEAVVPSEEPLPSEEPAPSDTAEPTVEPTATPQPAPSEDPVATPTPGTGSLESCTGTDENREFFASVAAAVDWPVFCAVLPGGWFVDSGQYRLASGGWLTIAYRGPGGTRLEIGEGAFCGEGDGCVPAGTDVGAAAFGDLQGTLVAADDGRVAVVVDRGAARSWVAVASGLDVGTVRSLVARFVRVGG